MHKKVPCATKDEGDRDYKPSTVMSSLKECFIRNDQSWNHVHTNDINCIQPAVLFQIFTNTYTCENNKEKEATKLRNTKDMDGRKEREGEKWFYIYV